MSLIRRILNANPCYEEGECSETLIPPPPTAVSGAGAAMYGPLSHRAANLLFVAAAALTTVLILSLVYYAALRRRRRFAVDLEMPIPPVTAAGGANFDEEEPLHHVWYIRTVGLDEATIASIAAAEYKSGAGGSDCTVCLAEFRDSELVRLLPKCGHAFHVPCIDTWLRAHVNCPLCRANIVDPNPKPIENADPAAVADGSPALTSDSPPIDEQSEIEGEDPNRLESGTVSEIRVPVRPAGELDLLPASSSSSVRRSVSMGTIVVTVDEDEIGNGGDDKDANLRVLNVCRDKDKFEDVSKLPDYRKARFEIGRSFSSSGRGFFFSRSGRGRNSSIPM